MSTAIGALAQELAQQNPWWRNPDGWAPLDPDLRDADRTGLHYRSGALADLEAGGLYILRGPRRVGKTVTVTQKVAELVADGRPPTSVVRLAVDGWAAKDLRTVVQNTTLPLVPDGHPRTWFIDEISAVTGDWAAQIKWLRDNDRGFRGATVILTGSNASALTEAAGTLAGRRGTATHVDRILLPIGFRTFAHLATNIATNVDPLDVGELHSATARERYQALVPWIDELVRAWETYLLYGGFPRAVAAAAHGLSVPGDFVEDMFQVIAGDAFAHSRLSATTEMALLERLWSAMGSPANLTKIGQDVAASTDVVSRHVGYLRDAYLLWSCPQRTETGWLARPHAQDKLYAIDPLVARLAYLRNAARDDIDPTVLNEMQLGMAIRRRVLQETPTAGNDEFLFHVRTASRKEIDFVADALAGVALEGKYTEGGRWASEAATVNASEWDGILATRNVLDLDTNAAWAVPAAFLAYLLDT